MPPICTRRCALAMRRSSAAACTEAAVSTLAQNAWIDTRGAGAMYSSGSVGPTDGSITSIVSTLNFMSVADVADSAAGGVRILGLGGLALAVLVEHGGSSGRIDLALGARLRQVGRVVDHGGEIALGGAAEIPVRLVAVPRR